ncbi:anti-sigma-W factor RsiW [Bacillus atrophaeus]|uniref:anti-sigma-W factor RsiW n=1 Tax=Bacillus atrophaeus TaxID=1452 RepID=UPI00228284D6|nr:anti-sigma-W factor RsiW [Bacillus atrophaeus]MCY8513596.1 anti-sigma-W factor RsiW [Bacillus atrophaeus]MCY8518883.1 anti-sigma-W factor RsiW [Bacillus atrophaeus]MCY8992700.1 anti-sigma-W factor RsiW [Bacillus atrophaeus]MCY9112530.1 anti-sigma-W factor RsiW [Bacillus atrophaeus]
MSCPEQIVQLMHKHLDGDILPKDEKELKDHLRLCEGCRNHFYEMEKSIALVRSTSHVEAPADFTANVMAKLPKEKKRASVKRWFRSHPIIAAAAVFIILMGGGFFNSWHSDHNFSVSKQPNLLVHNSTVIVPEGETVKGDVTVKNGKLIIKGKIDGNVTVVNGEKYMASAGQVTGEIEEIDELFDWVWYKMKSAGQSVVHAVNPNGEE